MGAEVIVTGNELPPEMIDVVREGRKVETIKMLRVTAGLGVTNAKAPVDRVARIRIPRRPIPNIVNPSPGSSQTVKSWMLIFVAVAAYLFCAHS